MCPDTEQPIPFQQPSSHNLYFREMEEAYSGASCWVKGIFSQVTAFCQISSGNWGALLLLADIRRLGLHPAILSCTCSQMSLARWLVVDVALILCNLDITVYKTTQDFGVLWNEITYSTDFLFFLPTVYEISIEMAVLICSSSPCWLRPASCSWIQQMFRLSRPMEALWTLFSSSPPRSKC